MYDLQAMKEAVKKCDVNIQVFEDAIDNELATKRKYQEIVRELESQEGNN